MAYTRTVVCFANSRKTAGRCIAGKIWDSGASGEWFRPVSSRPTHEISEEERRYQGGHDTRLLDIVTIPCSSPQPLPHQGENHLIDPSCYWKKEGSLKWNLIDSWTDRPHSLWANGDSSYAYLNNRVPDGYDGGVSLYLVAVDDLEVLVGAKSDLYPKRIVRGSFTYRGVLYRLAITDPVVERDFLARDDGSYVIGNPRLCVSLGDPFQGYFYKLIAAVLFEERFR